LYNRHTTRQNPGRESPGRCHDCQEQRREEQPRRNHGPLIARMKDRHARTLRHSLNPVSPSGGRSELSPVAKSEKGDGAEPDFRNEEGGGGERRRKHITTAAHDCKTLGSNCHHHLRGKAEANERREWAAWLPARRPAGRSAARRRRERPLRRYPPSGGFHALGAPRPCAGRAA